MLSNRSASRESRALRLGLPACIALVAACASEPDPEPVPSVANEPVPAVEEPPSVDHTIGQGETLWDIARAYGLTVDEVMEANSLSAEDERRLRVGRTLRIPGVAETVDVAASRARAAARREEATELPEAQDGSYHRLRDGETLWDVAHAYDRSLDELMERNQLTDDDVRSLRPGRPILVPGVRSEDIDRVARRPEPPAGGGVQHEIMDGETIWDLANAFRVGVSEIMAANGLSDAQVTALRPGRVIRIPGVTAEAGGRIVRRTTGTQRRAAARSRRLGLGTRAVAGKLLRGYVDPRWAAAAADRGSERLPGTLRWPVANGWFVRGFGSGEGGYHLAVDIAGEIGWNVRAAAAGIVAYSGNEVRGYGNLVMVVHAGGWVTMYAHNSTNFVVAGERVPRGAILAEVGSTGISRGPHVHFELMFSGRNCDPGPLFRPGIRHRNGRLSAVEKASWTRPGSRPRSVRCARRRRHPRSRWVVNE